MSTSARSVIPKFERIFSEFGYPSEITTDNGPPFRSQEFKEYAARCGFKVRNITPGEPKANGQAERFMKNIAKTVQTAIVDKKDWRKQLSVFLHNYRATPHQTTGKAPAELMFPNRNFKTKVPTAKPVTPYHQDKEVREQDQKKKQAMKIYADRKQYVKEHDISVNDIVLVPQQKRNKLATPYRNKKYVVTKVKGSMITARSSEGHVMTRDASKMKKIKVNESGQGREVDHGQDIDSESDELDKQKLGKDQTAIETSSPIIRRSSRVKMSTMNTKYKDYIV